MATSSSHVSNVPVGATGAAAEVAPGAVLRQAREQRGLTLAQLASLTKIPQRHLEAIESGNLAALPGDFYRRAEIRTYARAVHVDQQVALASFERAFATVTAPPKPIDEPRRMPPAITLSPRARGWIAFSVVSLAAILGFAMRTPRPTAVPTATAIETNGEATSATGRPAPGAGSAAQPLAPIAVGTSQTDPAVTAANAIVPVPAAEAAPGESTTPAATTTSIVITSEPAGARVTVDGIGWGVTPVIIRHLPPGEKRIRLSHDGFEASERVVDLGEGQRRSLAFRMRPSHDSR